MANHQNSSIRVYATLVPALKAPPHGSPGQRPGFRNRSVRPASAQQSSALAGRNRYLGHVPGALPRAGMLRALGASTWLSSQSEKPATDQFMSQVLDSESIWRWRALPQCLKLQIIGSDRAARTSLEIQELLQAIGRAGDRSRQAKFRHVVCKYAVDDVKLRRR